MSTVGINELTVSKYIREQENQYQIMDKISLKVISPRFEQSESQRH